MSMVRKLTGVAALTFLLELLLPMGTQATTTASAVTSATTRTEQISSTNVAKTIAISTETSEPATTTFGITAATTRASRTTMHLQTTTPHQTTVAAMNATALLTTAAAMRRTSTTTMPLQTTTPHQTTVAAMNATLFLTTAAAMRRTSTTTMALQTTTPHQTTVAALNATVLLQTTPQQTTGILTSTMIEAVMNTTWVNKTTTSMQTSTTVVTATVAAVNTTVGRIGMSATTRATTTLSMAATKARAIEKSTAMTTSALQNTTTTTSWQTMLASVTTTTDTKTSMGVVTVSSRIVGLQTVTSTPAGRFTSPTNVLKATTTTTVTQSATTSNAVMTQTSTTASGNKPACDVSVTGTAARRIGAMDVASTPSQTNCPANMGEMDACQAICSGGINATGYIRCFNGQLNDFSICVEPTSAEFKIDIAWKVFATIRVSIDGTPSRVNLISAISKALQVDASTVTMEWKLIERRLMLRAGKRRLATMFHEIKYEVVVFTGMVSKAVESVMAKARDLTSTGSSAFLTFSSSMLDAGLLVEKIEEVYPPVSHQSVVVLDDVGKIVTISTAAMEDPSELQPSATESQETDLGAFVGSIFGGVIGVMLVFASIYYWLLMRRKADA